MPHVVGPGRRTILLTTPALGRPAIGGVGVSAARIARHLAAEWDVRVVVPTGDVASLACRRGERDGLTTLEVGQTGDGEAALQRIADLLDEEAETAVEPVFAAFYCQRLAHAVTLAAARRGRRPVLFARGNDIDLDVFGPYGMHILHALDAASRVFCVSREMECKIRAYRPRAVTRYVPNGVDTATFDCRTPAAPRLRPVVGLFGDVKQKKGLELLLAALDFTTFDLRIVGSLREESRRLIHGFLTLYPEHRERVDLRPFTADERELVDHYHDVDIVCVPSIHDGMANVMLEALACGRACVCSEVGGARDVIVDGVNGFLFLPRSTAGLAAALGRAAEAIRSDPAGIAQAARAAALEHSAEIEARRYLQEFATLDS